VVDPVGVFNYPEGNRFSLDQQAMQHNLLGNGIFCQELFERRRQLKGETPSPATTLGKNA